MDKSEGSIEPGSLGLRTKTLGRKEPSQRMIIGCDFHPSWQQVSWLDTETGECGERKLAHASGDAKLFYQQLAAPVLIGMEATGNSQWFIELVEDLGHEVWIGDAAQIRASYVRKQKTDKRDAAHILKLVVEGRFPRLWTPDREQRDRRQLVLHRHKLVEIRSRVKNELQHLSLNKGMQKKRALWSQAGQKLLMRQPGVGPNTALAYVLTIGDVSRFRRGKQVASYLGLIPREESSGGRQKLGAITKQGNRMLRSLLVEAAQIAVRFDPGFRKQYLHRCHQKPKAVAKVAAARKLAVRLYWMLRSQVGYPEIVRIESSSRVALVGAS